MSSRILPSAKTCHSELSVPESSVPETQVPESNVPEYRALDLRVADTFYRRLLGVHRWALHADRGRGLLLQPCRAVHTFFLTRPIDVVFLDAQWHEVRHIASLPPGRIVWARTAVMVAELPPGYCAEHPDYLEQLRAAFTRPSGTR